MNDRAKTLKAADRRRALFEEAVAIIEAEYRKPLSLGEVAHRVGASTRNLQRAFAEVAGSSFSDHLRAVRLRRGAALLQDSELPVKTVAYLVGYRDHSDFSKRFRSHFGHPPVSYRRVDRAA